jgi:putative phage-type endonuclease
MKKVDLPQGSQLWKDYRRFRVPASEIAIVCGISPYETPLSLWERKIKGIEKEVTPAMQKGKDLEEEALRAFNCRMQPDIIMAHKWFYPAVYQHDDYDWMMASLDGWNNEYLVEIKCGGRKIHEDACNGIIPEIYLYQMQQQQMVTNTDLCYFCSYFEGEIHVIIVSKIEPIRAKILECGPAFYKCLWDFTPPPATDRDEVDITDNDLRIQADTLMELNLQINNLQEDYERRKKALIAKCTHSRCRIGKISLCKVIRRGAIDYSAIELLKNFDFEPYRKKPVESWRLTINEN